MLAATIVAPGHNRVVPLESEFILPQDGHDKQDCESRAAWRWLAAHGASHARFGAVYLGDDLFSRQPICQAVLDVGGHFLFVCKPGSHKAIAEFRAGISLDEPDPPRPRREEMDHPPLSMAVRSAAARR
jgi:hypothetical protein